MIDEIEDLVHWTLGVAGLSMLELRPSDAPSTSSEGSYSSYQFGVSSREQKPSIASSTSSEGGHSNPQSTELRRGQNHLNPFLDENAGLRSISPAMNHRSQPESVRRVRTGPFFLVPYPQNFNFVGQQSIIHQLRQFSDASKGTPNKIAISGLGGTGKVKLLWRMPTGIG